MADEKVTWGRAAWLILVPLSALPVGWWVGSQPVPARPAEEPVAATVASSAPAPAAGPTADGPPASPSAPKVEFRHTSGATEAPEAAAPAPREAERAEPAAVLSQWTTFDQALEESRSNGKPVFIDFSADWCGPCQRLRHEVFEDGARAHAFQSAVIPVSIVDQRRETGTNPPDIEELQQRYRVEAFPTLVVFNPANGKMATTRGFRGGDATLAWITEAAKSVR